MTHFVRRLVLENRTIVHCSGLITLPADGKQTDNSEKLVLLCHNFSFFVAFGKPVSMIMRQRCMNLPILFPKKPSGVWTAGFSINGAESYGDSSVPENSVHINGVHVIGTWLYHFLPCSCNNEQITSLSFSRYMWDMLFLGFSNYLPSQGHISKLGGCIASRYVYGHWNVFHKCRILVLL